MREMKTMLLVLGVLLSLSDAWGKKRLEQQIENGLWRVQYRHDGTLSPDEAYRKATCNLVRLAERAGYIYVALEHPWVGGEFGPPPSMGTRSVFYRFEAEVRLSNEPVAGGLPKVQDLNKDFMCGKWTVAYLKNSQAVETVRAAWGLWETVRTFSDVQLNQDTGDKNVSLTFSRLPDKVEVGVGCRLRKGTLSWKVYDPSDNIVWEGTSTKGKFSQYRRFKGAAGVWECRLSLIDGEGACRVVVGDVND